MVVKCEHSCQICNEEFETFEAKISHVIKNHSRACPYCSDTFSRPVKLRKHITRRHQTFYEEYQTAVGKIVPKTPPPKNLKCKICEKKFRYISQLREHEYAHNTEKVFSCKLCQKRLKHRSGLARHLKMLHYSKKYACKFCEYQTTKLCHLRKHDRENHLDVISGTIEEIPGI